MSATAADSGKEMRAWRLRFPLGSGWDTALEPIDDEAYSASASRIPLALLDGSLGEQDREQAARIIETATQQTDHLPQAVRSYHWATTKPERSISAEVVILAIAVLAALLYLPLRQLGSPSTHVVVAFDTAASIALVFSAAAIFLIKLDNWRQWSRVGAALLLIALDLFVRGTAQSLERDSSTSAGIIWVYAVPLAASFLFLLACAPQRSRLNHGELAGNLACFAVAAGAVLLIHGALWAVDDRLSTGLVGFLAQPNEPSLLRAIAGSLTLGTVFATILAALRRFKERRVPAWLLLSLVVWAVTQLSLSSTGEPRTAWPTNGFILMFATTIAFGVFLEMQRLREAAIPAAVPVAARSGGVAPFQGQSSELVKLVAHEIGSPLAAIRTWADFLSTDPSLSDRNERIVKGMQREIASVDALLADMRSVSMTRDNVFEVLLRPVAVGQIMLEAAQYAESLPGAHQVDTDITARQIVLADPVRIGQVLRNLLNNADKYSGPGSPIMLRATQHGARVRIEVIDQGMGIRDDDQGRIFKKFGRGRAVDERSIPGMGIGLYVAQSIVRAHHSEIRVTSTPDIGSRFAFDLRIIQ